MHKSVAWDVWEARAEKELRKAEERGRKKASKRDSAEALSEGRAEGRVDGELQALMKIGRQILGEPNALAKATLGAIYDAKRLDRMLDKILTVKSWKELLAIK